ncbi:MAG: PH domain-containing protein [Flavobacteriales bacterium]
MNAFVIDFSKPRRQHPLGLVVHLWQNVLRSLRAFFPLILVLAVTEKVQLALIWSGAALGFFLVIFTTLEYFRFRYHIERDVALVVRRGVLQLERLEIPFSRIQAVHLSRPLLWRVLGLTAVSLDTAGSSGNELEIRALSSAEAHALRQQLRHAIGQRERHVEEQPESPVIKDLSQLVLSLTHRDLLRIGLTMNHLRNGMLAFGAVAGVGMQILDVLSPQLDSLPSWQMGLLSLFSGLLWIMGILFFSVMGIFISMLFAVMEHYGLRLVLAKDRLELTSGLLRRNEYSILLSKVQILRWRNSWLQRAFALESLQIQQARAASEAGSHALKLMLPGLSAHHTTALEDIFNCRHSGETRLVRPVAFHLWLSRLAYFTPGLLFASAFAILSGDWLFPGSLFAGWMVYSWHAGRWYHEAKFVHTDGKHVWFHEGWWKRERSFARSHQLQRVTLTQHFLQVRRGSAHLHLHTAAGTVTMRHIDLGIAEALADEFLARVEAHRGPWM